MMKNLQDELYQLEYKQTKSFLTMLQNFIQNTWKTEYAKSNNIWVTLTDDTNQNILAVLRTFSNLQKIFFEKLYTKETTSKGATTEFLSKIPNRKKISNKDFKLYKTETFLDETINSQTSNDGLKPVFYKHFSNELAPVLLDVNDSWGKLRTMGVTSRTGVISAICKKVIKDKYTYIYLLYTYNIYLT